MRQVQATEEGKPCSTKTRLENCVRQTSILHQPTGTLTCYDKAQTTVTCLKIVVRSARVLPILTPQAVVENGGKLTVQPS